MCFISEWLDPQSGVLWKYVNRMHGLSAVCMFEASLTSACTGHGHRYQLFWYPASKEVEIVSLVGMQSTMHMHQQACSV